MKSNVGNLDRVIRFSFGLMILALGLFFESWWGLIGLILLATAAAGWCPAYRLLGLSTEKSSPTGHEAETT